ncbi:hypothetical protein GCM10009813_06110 [Brevibacterium marinum]
MLTFLTMWRNMKMLRGRQSTGRKIAVGGVAAATALGLTLMTTSPGAAEEQNPAEDAEAFGQLIDASLLEEDAVEALSAYSSSPSSEEADTTPLNLEVLQTLGIELPGLSLPLISEEGGDGLLDLGNAGALNAYGHAPAYNEAKASAGAVGSDGALNLDDINNGEFGNANVDLTAVLGQLGLDGITDEIVDELSLELGAIASTADSNGEADNSEYVVADGILTVSSPAVSDISSTLTELVDGTGETLEEVIGDEGLVNDLAGLGLDIDVLAAAVEIGGENTTVTVEVRDALNSVVENVINEALEDQSGIVSIDLESGDIKIDLAKIVEGGNGEDLNGLDPNTQVLTSDTISKITTAVADALGELTGKVTETMTEALNEVHLVIELPASIELLNVGAANGKVTVDATLGQLAGTDNTDPIVDTDLSLLGVPVGTVLNAITQPLITAVLNITEPLVGGILTATVDELSGSVTGIVDPLLDNLDPVFGALNQVVELTINEQPTLKDQESQVKGDNGPGFTVSAVSLELLPGVDPDGDAAPQAAVSVADINLASSSVRATDEAPEEPGDEDANTNAAASAAASADADDDSNASAQVAAQAAAQADASTDESAAADATAEAAAESAATEDASSETSADATTETNASANVAAEAASNADNTDATNADTNAAADADPAAAASVASNADSSSEASAAAAADADDSAVADASSESDVNANASASASASANADNNENAVAEAAAQAAATADADTTASAAADVDASAAAESAATEDASSETSADATTETNASATAAAEAAAFADATEEANADTTAASDANAAAASAVAANADSSAAASAEAAANDETDAAAEGDDSNVDTTAAADADGAEADADGAAAEADADGAEAEASASADADGAEASASSDDDADKASASADSDQSASTNASASSNASAGSSTNAAGSSDGGDLPRTGADGALTMVGFAALLIAGGAAVVFGTRRYRASAGRN